MRHRPGEESVRHRADHRHVATPTNAPAPALDKTVVAAAPAPLAASFSHRSWASFANGIDAPAPISAPIQARRPGRHFRGVVARGDGGACRDNVVVSASWSASRNGDAGGRGARSTTGGRSSGAIAAGSCAAASAGMSHENAATVSRKPHRARITCLRRPIARSLLFSL
jgi:hypothetical protein